MIKEVFLKFYYLWIPSQAQPDSYKWICPKLPVNEKRPSEKDLILWLF